MHSYPYIWNYLPLVLQILVALGLAVRHGGRLLSSSASTRTPAPSWRLRVRHGPRRRRPRPLLRPLLHGRDALHPVRRGSRLHAALGGDLPPSAQPSPARACSASGRCWSTSASSPSASSTSGRKASSTGPPIRGTSNGRSSLCDQWQTGRLRGASRESPPSRRFAEPLPPTPSSTARADPHGRPREHHRRRARPLQQAGYNFLEDVTASTGTPPSRASRSPTTFFRTALKERVRLVVRLDSDDASTRQHHSRLALRQLLRARSLRSLRRPLRRPSQPAPHHDAGRLAGTSLAQGLPRGGLPLMTPCSV